MVEVTYSLLDVDQDIRLKFECVASYHKYKRICRGITEDRKSLSEKSALELELDINEIQELQTMCTAFNKELSSSNNCPARNSA